MGESGVESDGAIEGSLEGGEAESVESRCGAMKEVPVLLPAAMEEDPSHVQSGLELFRWHGTTRNAGGLLWLQPSPFAVLLSSHCSVIGFTRPSTY